MSPDKKGLKVPLVAIDIGKGEHHSASYGTINRVVPRAPLPDPYAENFHHEQQTH
jgi:hypothetical protein